MNVLPIDPTPAETLSALDGRDLILAQSLTRRCTPREQVMVGVLTSCERLADRVAALEKKWGAIIGSDLLMAAWTALHSLARVTRNQTRGYQH
jgi:hypothetical protein